MGMPKGLEHIQGKPSRWISQKVLSPSVSFLSYCPAGQREDCGKHCMRLGSTVHALKRINGHRTLQE